MYLVLEVEVCVKILHVCIGQRTSVGRAVVGCRSAVYELLIMFVSVAL